MNEELKQHIKENTRNVIQETLDSFCGQEEQLDESVEVVGGLLALAAIGSGWYWIRKKLISMRKNKMVDTFFQTYDKNKMLEKSMQNVSKRFKLVSTLADLKVIEDDVKTINIRFDELLAHAESFDVSKFSKGNKALALDKEKEKKRMTSELKKFIAELQETFAREIEDKKEEILA